jgi:hypothetical protein
LIFVCTERNSGDFSEKIRRQRKVSLLREITQSFFEEFGDGKILVTETGLFCGKFGGRKNIRYRRG